MKLDAETIRKLALSGARTRLRELESEVETIRGVVRQLTGASAPVDGRRREHRPKRNGRRKRRVHSDQFKALVVKEAHVTDNVKATARKHNVSPSLVRMWMDKAK